MSSTPAPKFRFGRSSVAGRPGESLLATLARSGWPRLVRSIRYHRPRGPFCGVGDCTGCLVRVDGRPNVRACLYRPKDGDVIRTENSFPSPGFDLFGAVDRLMSSGFDTLHGLRRPAFAAPLYQWVVRRLAGYGRPAPADLHRPVPAARTVRAPVVIVGAGDSGRRTAAELVAAGSRPLLVERDPMAPPVAGADLLEGVTAAFLPPPDPRSGEFALLGFTPDGAGVAVRSPQVVVATGGYDGTLLFEGSDRPGVVTADLVDRFPGLPFGEPVVVGGGRRAADLLDRFPGRVRAIVAPGEIGPDVVARAAVRGIPLYPRSLVLRAAGRRKVRSLLLVARGEGNRTQIRCDSVILAHRRLPNAQLLFQAGARRYWRNEPGAFYPELTDDGRSSVPGLWAVGTAARAGAGRPEEPALVAAAIGGRPRAGEPLPPPGPEPGLSSYYRELLALPRREKWVVCPCEDVLLHEVEEAVRRGYRGMEVVKRYTGVGTGLCQGRYCVPETLLILAALEGRSPPEVGTITQRPPVVPTPLVALAGLTGEFDHAEEGA